MTQGAGRDAFHSMFSTRGWERLTKYIVLIGSMLLNTPNALPWFLGNILTYAYSYFRYHLDASQVYRGITWLLPIFLTFVVVGMVFFDGLLKILSMRKVIYLAVFVYNAGLFLTYFTVQHSIWTMQVTFSICVGLGHGVMLSISFVFAQQWFHTNVGTATSVVASSGGLGAVVITAIATSYLNPSNLKPDLIDGNLRYFSTFSIQKSFPILFLILGLFSTIVHIIAILLLEASALRVTPEVDRVRILKGEATSLMQISPVHEESPNRAYTKEAPHENGNLQGNSTVTSQKSSYKKTHATRDCCNSEYQSDAENQKASTSVSFDCHVLRSERFYHMWFCELFLSFGFTMVTSCYKLFGQYWIHDDDFLAIIGGVADLTTIFSRIAFGFVIDSMGVFNTISAMLTLTSISLAFWYFAARLSGVLYLVWTSFLIGMLSATFTVFPVAMLEHFGSEQYATNVGLSMSSLVAGSLLTPPLIHVIVTGVGWFWLFILASVACLVGQVLFLLRVPPKTG